MRYFRKFTRPIRKLSQKKGVFSQKKRYLFINIIKNKNYLLLIKNKTDGKYNSGNLNTTARC